MMDQNTFTDWHKSSYSSGGANCVEVAVFPGGGVNVRDSKDPDGPTLTFTTGNWRSFTQGVTGCRFDNDVAPKVLGLEQHCTS